MPRIGVDVFLNADQRISAPRVVRIARAIAVVER